MLGTSSSKKVDIKEHQRVDIVKGPDGYPIWKVGGNQYGEIEASRG